MSVRERVTWQSKQQQLPAYTQLQFLLFLKRALHRESHAFEVNHPSVCLSLIRSPFVWPCVCLSVCMSVRPSVRPSVCLSVSQSPFLYVCPICFLANLSCQSVNTLQRMTPTLNLHLSALVAWYCSLTVVKSSEPNRSHLHLGPLGGVVIPLPSFPVDAVSIRRVLTVMVQTIQVGAETGCVPPGAFVLHSTVTTPLIIVSVFGGERHSTVRGERVTRCACWNRDEVIIATYQTFPN